MDTTFIKNSAQSLNDQPNSIRSVTNGRMLDSHQGIKFFERKLFMDIDN